MNEIKAILLCIVLILFGNGVGSDSYSYLGFGMIAIWSLAKVIKELMK